MARSRRRAESRARYYIRDEAQKKGWNLAHVSSGGDCLEEQEIMGHFPNIGLGLDRPDFLFCLNGDPAVVIEAKNEADKIDDAIDEAIEYAETINSTGLYTIKIAVGAAGEEDAGFTVNVRYLIDGEWVPLKSNGYEITTIPSKREVELALQADDATTSVTIPSNAEFIDAAIELSRILRSAKVEAPLRPKVIGAMVLSMYEGEIDTTPENALESVNTLVENAINEARDIPEVKKGRLIDALRLSGADFERLSPFIRRVVSILRRLNIRSVLQTDTDFLGMFYEAFLRYGYDNNALGIVFTPRHITRFCVDLVGVSANDKVIDIASGTGGFLVAAFDEMMKLAQGSRAIQQVKSSLYGFDTNPTVWALATLNMFFRGDGKSHIEQGNSLDEENKRSVEGRFTRAFLNPPFSQEEEPERFFIDASMNALEPNGIMAVVVKAGIFADDEHRSWRREFLRNHTILAVISLPEDLFYPNASAPTSILIAKAHIPHENKSIFLGRIWNDGFEKLKNRRIDRPGSQLNEIKQCFHSFLRDEEFNSELAICINGNQLSSGQEWSPQEWLPQPNISADEIEKYQQNVVRSIFQTTTLFPELADEVLEEFPEENDEFEDFETGIRAPLSTFFDVLTGKSSGEKNYNEGLCPYISSGDSLNSIVRLIEQNDNQVFNGGITVTAFGKAYVQPWQFMARGNGGSAVRVLIPKYNMTFKELVWFAAQINLQQWRFFYARMAIKSRISRLIVESPDTRLYNDEFEIHERVNDFIEKLDEFSDL
ncbi:N-6 DNA methylase [Bacillus subtilis]|uniref:N-6 DNA methylase n=1 Tax=Bacillus subtilis TaxID=1423 RepID=UPI00345BC002